MRNAVAPYPAQSAETSFALEALEARILLANAAPVLLTDLVDITLASNGAFTLPVNAFDADGDKLTFTATSSNPNFQINVPTGDTFAKMFFKDGDGQDMGYLLVQLFTSRTHSIPAAQRFIALSTYYIDPITMAMDIDGTPFYTDVPVHRIIDGFMFQSGDAANGNGTGDSPLPDLQASFDPFLSFANKGLLAMGKVSGNDDSSNSQFFITDGQFTSGDRQYMIFGQLIGSQDVMDAIMGTPVEDNGSNEISRPISIPLLDHVEILSATDVLAMQNNTLIITPVNKYAGSTIVTVTVSDGNGGTIIRQIELNAAGLDEVKPITMKPGTSTVVDLSVYDAAQVSNIYAWSGNINVSIVPLVAERQLLISAQPGFTGAVAINVAVEFEGIGQVVKTFYIGVGETNDPLLASGVVTEFGNTPMGVFASGNRLYLANGSSGVTIYDLSILNSPRLMGSFNTPGSARNIKVVGTTAYVADTYGGIIAYDVKDPMKVRLLAQWSQANTAILDFVIKGSYLFAAGYNKGFYSFDISKTSQIRKLDSYTADNRFGQGFTLTTMDVVLKGNYAFISDAAGAVFIMNIRNPRNVTMANPIFLPVNFNPWSIALSGNYLSVVSQNDNKLLVYDVSNPLRADMTPAGTLNNITGAWEVAAAGNKLYVSTASGVSIVDISAPAAPAVIDQIQGGAGQQVFITGLYAIISQDSNGAAIMCLDKIGTTTFKDSRPNTVTVKMAGIGQYRLITKSLAGGDLQLLDAINTTASSSLSISTYRNRTTKITDINTSTIGAMTARTSYLIGSMTTGAASSITFYGIVGGDIAIAQPANDDVRLVTLSLGRVTNGAVESLQAINTLSVRTWYDTDATVDVIQAPSIYSLISTSTFQADLDLAGGDAAAVRLNAARIGGTLGGAGRQIHWNVQGGVISVSLIGTVNGWALDCQNLTSLVARSVATGDVNVVQTAGAIRAYRWLGGSIEAASITSLRMTGAKRISGDLGADVNIVGNADQTNLTAATIAGRLTGGTWNVSGKTMTLSIGSVLQPWSGTFDDIDLIATKASMIMTSLEANSIRQMTVGKNLLGLVTLTQDVVDDDSSVLALGRLNVAGSMVDADIRTAGHIGIITTGRMISSSVIAGSNQQANELPGFLNDFTSEARIDVLAIKGLKGSTYAFENSNIAAAALGNISIMKADVRAGNNFGLAGGSLSSFTYRGSTGNYTWPNALPADEVWPETFTLFQVDMLVLQQPD